MLYENKEYYGSYLKKIIHKIMKMQDSMLAPFDITNQQARLVNYISYHQENEEPICQKDLECLTGLKGSSITSLLQGLEKKEFIVRRCGSTDARMKQISLTEKGYELNKAFKSVFEETEKKILRGMSEGEKTMLLELLKRASDNLEDNSDINT